MTWKIRDIRGPKQNFAGQSPLKHLISGQSQENWDEWDPYPSQQCAQWSAGTIILPDAVEIEICSGCNGFGVTRYVIHITTFRSLGPTLSTTALRLEGYMDHPLNSPDLAPSDFQLSRPLKKHLARKCFAIDADVKQPVTSRLQTLDTDRFYTTMQALLPRWDNA